jgi:hypothetical protein
LSLRAAMPGKMVREFAGYFYPSKPKSSIPVTGKNNLTFP